VARDDDLVPRDGDAVGVRGVEQRDRRGRQRGGGESGGRDNSAAGAASPGGGVAVPPSWPEPAARRSRSRSRISSGA
jgi:hypothetical protein